MTDLPISENLATRLEELAQLEAQSVEELLTALIEKHQSMQVTPQTEQPSNVLLAIAQAAETYNLRSEEDDISERSDEYVADAITEHFKKPTKK